MQVEPSSNSSKPRWITRTRLVWAGLLAGLVFAWGSDHQPADATRPMVWHEPASPNAGTTAEFRLASFNIHGGKGTDGVRDLARIAADLQDVDFAALFEVHADPWNRFSDQAVELGERLGLRSAFFPTEHTWWRDGFGNALLTSADDVAVQRIPLVGTRGKAFRQAVLVDVPWNGRVIHIVMVHVDSGRDRERQLETVIRLFQSLEAPAILMGDLNSRPDDPRLKALLSEDGIENVLSKLGDKSPTENIDWIIIRGLECVEAAYHHSGASDHPVVKATLR